MIFELDNLNKKKLISLRSILQSEKYNFKLANKRKKAVTNQRRQEKVQLIFSNNDQAKK